MVYPESTGQTPTRTGERTMILYGRFNSYDLGVTKCPWVREKMVGALGCMDCPHFVHREQIKSDPVTYRVECKKVPKPENEK